MPRGRRPIVTIVAAGLLVLSACAAATMVRGPGAGNLRDVASRATGREPTVAVQAAEGDVQSRSLRSGGEQRDYLLYVPPAALRGQPTPLVLAFHGGGGEAGDFASRAGLVAMAQRYGYILAVPQGLRNSWNNGSTTGFANRSGVDDVGFVRDLIGDLERDYAVDRGRLFATGISAGGMMSYRLACEMPGTFAAIAAVAATLTVPRCPGASQTSLLHIHGTNDQNVPLDGGAGQFTSANADYPSALSGVELFRRSNQCGGAPSVSRPASDTVCEVSACGDGEVVELCEVQGGGHAWPGVAPTRRQSNRSVYVSQQFDATDFIGRFFQSR